ncbi:MAG TPA: ABC transporter permease [Gaiellaceae bacterium]|nr:ABC transporter permease [Gaiellaceae bacterium]
MRLWLHELRVEQLLFWRNREAAFFTFFLPVIFFLIFGSVYGDDTIKQEGGMKASRFLEAGMIGYGVAATCFAGLGISLVVRRESGVLKRIRATPLPPATYILGVLASTFVVFLIEAVLIVAIGRALFDVPVPDALPSLVAVLALGALAFAGMGLGISGLVRTAEGSSAVINAVYLPMAIISGTFFTPETYPGFLKAIADVLPLTHYTRLTRDVMLRGEHFWTAPGAIAVVAAWGAVGVAGAVRGFRWQPRET